MHTAFYWIKKYGTILSYLIVFLYACIFLLQKDFVLALEDLGRHVTTGKIITTCLCVPKINLFSYTNSSFPFVNHHWLSEVLFFLSTKFFSLESLIILKAIIIIACIFIMFSFAKQKGSLFWTVVISLLELKLLSGRLHVRPELFSFLMISLFILILERYKQTKRIAWLFLLPILQILWANMHIYFFLGICIYGLFLLEQIVFERISVNKSLFLIFLLILFAPLINPNGLSGAIEPLMIFHNYGIQINENESIFQLNAQGYSSDIIFAFEITVVMFFISLIRKFRRDDFFYVTFTVCSVIAAFGMIRNIPIFVFASWIPLTYGLTTIEQYIRKHVEKSFVDVGKAFLVCVIFFSTVVLDVNQALAIGAFSPTYFQATQPAVSFFLENNLQGPIFNNLIIGSYLISRLYPKEKVFVDARPEAYPASFLAVYQHMMEDPVYFTKQAEANHINTIILSLADNEETLLIHGLQQNSAWVMVYRDPWTIIFVKNNKQNKNVIQKFAN